MTTIWFFLINQKFESNYHGLTTQVKIQFFQFEYKKINNFLLK